LAIGFESCLSNNQEEANPKLPPLPVKKDKKTLNSRVSLNKIFSKYMLCIECLLVYIKYTANIFCGSMEGGELMTPARYIKGIPNNHM
jgi:hypothetical protein